LTHIQTNIHRKFGQGGGNTTHGKARIFSDFPRLICAATALYFRVSRILFGKGSVDRERTSVTRCGTQWVLVHNRQGCIQHGDIVNKAFGKGKPCQREGIAICKWYNLATKHFDVLISIIKSNKALTCSLNL
jgi:hypothetical protein